MKKILIICSLPLLFGIGACKKTLDVKPDASIDDQDIYVSSQKIEAAMNGVYDAAQSGFYAGGAVRGYPFGSASIQQGDMRGEDMLNTALFYQVTYESTYDPTTANQQFMFETLYSLINKANLFIEGVQGAAGGVITQAKANQYIGEALFLRALAHHELMINFARPYGDAGGSKQGIIYRTKGVDTPEEVEVARQETRKTVAENYTRLLADLDSAESLLPAISSTDIGTGVRTFRASKGAAVALKMRAKLHMQDWAGVVTEGNKLAPQQTAPFSAPATMGGFLLEASPVTPFRTPQSLENIFSIRNASADNPGVNGALANMLGDVGSGGRGLVQVSPIIYNLPEWTCEDKRRTELLIRFPLNAGAPQANTAFYTLKYIDPRTSTDPAPIIRYAEVLLMLAEAEARLAAAPSARALALLNAVRNRSLSVPATQAYTLASFATSADLVRAILAERRIEFVAEGKRWGDIHRLAVIPGSGITGIPAKLRTASASFAQYSCGAGSTPYASALTVGAIPYADRRFILPIPLTETQQNPNFAQNPNY